MFKLERELRHGLMALIVLIGKDAPPTKPGYYPNISGEQTINHAHSG
jgi:hypothetical protein